MIEKIAVKAIISDLDGVIRFFPEERANLIEIKYSIPQGVILKSAFSYTDLNEVVTGKITDERWRANIAKRVSKFIPVSEANLAIEEWTNYPGEINHVVLNTYKKLKRDRPFYLMTNGTDKLVNDIINLKIGDVFDFIINSSELGFAKPDEEIFSYALSKLNLMPGEVVFIDDSEKIISKANELGFICHLYQDVQGFQYFCRDTLS